MTWRDVIRTYLHQKDWTQTSLAQESRIPASNLSEIMTGRRKPTLRQLERLAMGLGTTLSAIMALKEREASPDHDLAERCLRALGLPGVYPSRDAARRVLGRGRPL